MKTQFKPIKPSPSLVALALALALAGCTTAPYSQQPSSRTPSAKAPVVDRSARRPPAYSTRRPAPPADTGQLPEEDPLLPREYASDPYGASAQPYPTEAGGSQRRPAYPPSASGDYRQPAYPPSASGGDYRQPAYPPSAATPYSSSPQPYPAPANEYGRPAPTYAPTDERYSTQPAPGALPEPQPVVPRTPATAPSGKPPATPAAPAPSKPAVALVPPPVAPKPEPEPEPEPIQPPARPSPPPAAPAAPPAELPPAEITREGNQAVAALLESADKYVKSKQLDKAGAALERALRIEPRNAGIWHDLAQIRLHQGQYQQAESLASKSNNLAGGNRSLQSRNWKVIASARKATGNAAGAEEAEARATQFSR
ncbi:MAG: tetratricopeptide repeat protein [Candidatus Contendobacter sp.]|nr:tetratricopeptide repeat protein [Candidatus Contendobacter sp.]MDS4057800.1 tetratricopeptide repeat protein [Candidatus Contendobacter sp.]